MQDLKGVSPNTPSCVSVFRSKKTVLSEQYTKKWAELIRILQRRGYPEDGGERI